MDQLHDLPYRRRLLHSMLVAAFRLGDRLSISLQG
jgi:hypothetical protein